jgi:hypothetical protein
LLELIEAGSSHICQQLGLTNEKNMQELFSRSFHVGEQTYFFQERGMKILGFIKNKDAFFGSFQIPVDSFSEPLAVI